MITQIEMLASIDDKVLRAVETLIPPEVLSAEFHNFIKAEQR